MEGSEQKGLRDTLRMWADCRQEEYPLFGATESKPSNGMRVSQGLLL